MTKQYIYEATDSTNDERYWTLGLWLSADEAINAIRLCTPSQLDEFSSRDSGHFCVTINRRVIGFGDSGTTVYQFDWLEMYNESKDEYEWILTEDDKRE